MATGSKLPPTLLPQANSKFRISCSKSQATQVQMQATLQQMQATMAQMQATTAQLQEDFTAMRWNQANSAIRFQNRNNRGILCPLHNPVGALPPPEMQVPQTRSQADALTVNRLNQLQDFYQVQFPGALVTDRRRAFWEFMSEPVEV